jgi:hypothetical protein
MITVICKAHKRKWLDNIITNFENQTHQDKEILFVFNGELENYEVPNPGNVIQLRSKSNMLGVLDNIALNWMRQNQRKIYAIFDSDDWYGESYLSDSILYLSNNHLIGKTDISFRFRDIVYKTEGAVKTDIWNPTFIGILTDVNYSEEMKLCHDIDYLSRFRSNHYSIGFNESKNNWVYNVTSESTQNREDWKIWKAMTAFNTISKNKDFKIIRGEEIVWKYGDSIINNQEDIQRIC